MSDRAATRVTRDFEVPYTPIHNDAVSTAQLQRAWCLMLVKSLWPTVDIINGLAIARWLFDGQKSGGA
jgi:hypothetical protein